MSVIEDETFCAREDCDRLAMEWWWVLWWSPDGGVTKVFRHFCEQHHEQERASDLAAFGPDGYIPGSEVGE
jgi:hypothetical protein